MNKISDSIKEVFFNIPLKKSYNYYLIKLNLEWKNIVKLDYYLFSYPIKIINILNTDKCLIEIAVKSNIIGMQLYFNELEILNQINLILGFNNFINKIKISNRPDLW
ncbi:MAG: hypothetical protein U1E31_02700 [Rickettsiales bacterium]